MQNNNGYQCTKKQKPTNTKYLRHIFLCTKSLTGMYCDINQSLDLHVLNVELMFKREIVACGIAKSIHEIEFEAPCSPTNHRINYKLASKQLRNQAVACLIKRNDVCTAVGTW